jgi:hypothetical protein
MRHEIRGRVQNQQERINTLIALIRERPYDKGIDQFKQAECVICFEEFQQGVSVRKIPICQHVFHSKCIDEWFKAKLQEANQKCPLCNADINIEKVKEALKKNRE